MNGPNFTILYLNAALRGRDCGPAMHGAMIVQYLRAAGAEVHCVPSIGERANSPTPKHDFLRGILPHEILTIARGTLRTLGGVLTTFTYHHHPPNVVLARHFDYELLPLVVASGLQRPLVLEVNAPMYLERRLQGRRTSRLLRMIEAYQWKRADAVHAVSRGVRDVLEKEGVPRDRIHVIPNGADPELARRIRRTRPEVAPVRILFVGGFYRWHGVLDLLKAFSKAVRAAPSLRLCLVGDGDDKVEAKRLAQALGIAERVEFAGFLTRQDLAQKLANAEIGVAPYQPVDPFYLSPLKLFEYMAAGLAVVASAQGQIRELITDGREGLLYCPGAVDQLSTRLIELAKDPYRRWRLGVNARRRVLAKYTWVHTAERLLAICRDVAAVARE